MLHIKKKDKVMVVSGDDKGKQGEVVKIFPDENRVIISKINFAKKHSKPKQTEPGGIKQMELPVHISNIQLICPKCNQRVKPKFDWLSDGKKVRICRKCGEMII